MAIFPRFSRFHTNYDVSYVFLVDSYVSYIYAHKCMFFIFVLIGVCNFLYYLV